MDRLTHKVPLWCVVSIQFGCVKAVEGGRATTTNLESSRSEVRRKALKIEERGEKNVFFAFWEDESYIFQDSANEEDFTWMSRGFSSSAGGCETKITACSNCWLLIFVSL